MHLGSVPDLTERGIIAFVPVVSVTRYEGDNPLHKMNTMATFAT